jgi:hypothetical protein
LTVSDLEVGLETELQDPLFAARRTLALVSSSMVVVDGVA